MKRKNMKRTYIKPCTEIVLAKSEEHLLLTGSPVNNYKGNLGQLSKKNSFIFYDDFYDEDEQ